MTKQEFLDSLSRGVSDFHAGPCTRTFGPKGGLRKESTERWRLNGTLKLWTTRPPDEFRQPIKHGLKNYAYIDHTNVSQFHPEDKCAPVDTHLPPKSPASRKSSAPHWIGSGPIVITKTLLDRFTDTINYRKFWHSDQWLTNGHWMIRRDQVRITSQALDLFSPNLTEKNVQDYLAKVAQCTRQLAWIGPKDISVNIYGDLGSSRKGYRIHFDSSYIAMLKTPGWVYAHPTDPNSVCAFKHEDGTVWAILMPRRI